MNLINQLRRYRWYLTGRIKIRKSIQAATKKGRVNVVLGASHIMYADWICTDLPHFDILNENSWKYLFNGNYADTFLSEHVFEHLTPAEVRKAATFCYNYLNAGGRLRIAVPDELHTNPKYIEYVRMGGSGPGAHDHRSMWNINSLSNVLQEIGFNVHPIEYWTKEGKLHVTPFNDQDGPVRRSAQRNLTVPGIPDYSSLILDAIK